jgi:hypothetical protein
VAPFEVLVKQVRAILLLCVELHGSMPELGQVPTGALGRSR